MRTYTAPEAELLHIQSEDIMQISNGFDLPEDSFEDEEGGEG